MSVPIIYQYPACSTCKKALRWLDDRSLEYRSIHIVEDTPDAALLETLIKKSGLPPAKFFNTSGKRYRELGLKDKVKAMSIDEAAGLLAGDGMLLKRPLVISGDRILLGFRENEWQDTF